jgi:hypothetical protein
MSDACTLKAAPAPTTFLADRALELRAADPELQLMRPIHSWDRAWEEYLDQEVAKATIPADAPFMTLTTADLFGFSGGAYIRSETVPASPEAIARMTAAAVWKVRLEIAIEALADIERAEGVCLDEDTDGSQLAMRAYGHVKKMLLWGDPSTWDDDDCDI